MSSIQDVTHSSIASSTGNSALKSSTASSTSSTSSSESTSSSSTKKSSDIMGKQDFLTLLVTQLKNQDPLNPDNPTEFTAQLAQFSSLEQLYNLNDSMAGLVTSTDNANNLSALGLIGKEVTFPGSSFTYSGDPIKLGYQLDGPASGVQLFIQDGNGKTIRTLTGTELTKGNHVLTWDGRDSDGNEVTAGSYKAVIQAKGVDSTGVAASPIVTSQVTGVDMSSGSAVLNTKAGDIAFSKILGVFSPTTSSSSTASSSTAATEESSESTAATTDTATGTEETTL